MFLSSSWPERGRQGGGPQDEGFVLRTAVAAEEVGFHFEVSSDHYFPWLDSMGHAPYAWTVLGAVAHATERVEQMTYVTCPTLRYHPAVAARQDMLQEAIEIIRELHTGERVTYDGAHFRVDSAKVWDLPEQPVAAVSGHQSVARFAPTVDHLVAVEPEAELVDEWASVRRENSLRPSRTIGQIPICWGTDREAQVAVAHYTFRWFAGGWSVNADLPTPAGFAGATQFVRPEDVAESIPCGPDLDAIVAAVAPFWEAGFSDVALVQVGDGNQQEFLDTAAGPLLEKLRAAAPSS